MACRHLARRSIAVFIHPDCDTVIESIDGSNKYPAFVAGEDIVKKIKDTVST